jgi:hypothetical protein
LTSCNNHSSYYAEAKWQEVYAALLREYLYKDGTLFFTLHDFDLDGIPELIIAGELNDEIVDVVYTISDGHTLQLAFDEYVYIAGFALSARAGIASPPEGIPGLIAYLSGAGSLFGSNRFYSHIVINGNNLSINVRGAKIIDFETLHEINATINGLTSTAEIEEHVSWSFNDEAVTSDKFYRLFMPTEEIAMLRINEANINITFFSEQE